MAHSHITAWVVAIILLFVVTSLYNQGKAKPAKITHMVLRLLYLVIIITGVMLFFSYANYSGELFLKVIAGLWTIVAIEMITVKTKKGKATKAWWIQFVIAAVIAITLGFTRLPMGILP